MKTIIFQGDLYFPEPILPWIRTQSLTNEKLVLAGQRFLICQAGSTRGYEKNGWRKSKPLRRNGARSRNQRDDI
ncbi:MAG: hypothetical protein M3O66_03735 [Verrucomicrobiota bacterium]|nr:hypothetical protein [Verrucomicrobiota bacterium]